MGCRTRYNFGNKGEQVPSDIDRVDLSEDAQFIHRHDMVCDTSRTIRTAATVTTIAATTACFTISAPCFSIKIVTSIRYSLNSFTERCTTFTAIASVTAFRTNATRTGSPLRHFCPAIQEAITIIGIITIAVDGK